MVSLGHGNADVPGQRLPETPEARRHAVLVRYNGNNGHLLIELKAQDVLDALAEAPAEVVEHDCSRYLALLGREGEEGMTMSIRDIRGSWRITGEASELIVHEGALRTSKAPTHAEKTLKVGAQDVLAEVVKVICQAQVKSISHMWTSLPNTQKNTHRRRLCRWPFAPGA